MDVPELDSIKVMILIYGEYGDIVYFALCDNEGPQNWQLCHYFLMRRCERMGHKFLHAVVDGYDDLGSGTLKDPSQHWFAKIWPAVKRAPRKDHWHGCDLVLRNTTGPSHPIHDEFSKKLHGALLYFLKPDIDKAIKQCMRENPSMRPEVAEMHVLNEQKWKRKMHNASRKSIAQRQLVEAARQWAKNESAKYEADGFPPYFRKATPKSRSTDQEIDFLISHIDRQDYQDPFPPHQMSIPRKDCVATNVEKKATKGGLLDLTRIRGTNTGESSNKQVNNSTQNATRLRQELGEAKAKLRIHSHNLKKDREFGGKTGRKAKSLLWMLQEANWENSKTKPTSSNLPTMRDFFLLHLWFLSQ